MIACRTDPADGVVELTVAGAVTRAVGALFPAEIGVFPHAGLDEARQRVRQN